MVEYLLNNIVEGSMGTIKFVNFEYFLLSFVDELMLGQPIPFKPHIWGGLVQGLFVVKRYHIVQVQMLLPLFTAYLLPNTLIVTLVFLFLQMGMLVW